MPDTSGLIFWAGLFLLVVAVLVPVGIYGARALRRRLQQPQSGPTFTVQDLCEMRARGQVTEQEFEAMRTVVLRTFAATERPRDDGPGDASDQDGRGREADAEEE